MWNALADAGRMSDFVIVVESSNFPMAKASTAFLLAASSP
jgi:hypothetical protein